MISTKLLNIPKYIDADHAAKPAIEAAIPLSFGKLYKDPGKINVCMADLIVKAAVKEALDDMNVASDFYDALDDEVEELLDDAARRAEENDRKTVQPRDL